MALKERTVYEAFDDATGELINGTIATIKFQSIDAQGNETALMPPDIEAFNNAVGSYTYGMESAKTIADYIANFTEGLLPVAPDLTLELETAENSLREAREDLEKAQSERSGFLERMLEEAEKNKALTAENEELKKLKAEFGNNEKLIAVQDQNTELSARCSDLESRLADMTKKYENMCEIATKKDNAVIHGSALLGNTLDMMSETKLTANLRVQEAEKEIKKLEQQLADKTNEASLLAQKVEELQKEKLVHLETLQKQTAEIQKLRGDKPEKQNTKGTKEFNSVTGIDENEYIELYNQGMNYHDLGVHFGRSSKAMANKAYILAKAGKVERRQA